MWVCDLCLEVKTTVLKTMWLVLVFIQKRRLHSRCDVSASRLRFRVHLGQEGSRCNKLPCHQRRFGPTVRHNFCSSSGVHFSSRRFFAALHGPRILSPAYCYERWHYIMLLQLCKIWIQIFILILLDKSRFKTGWPLATSLSTRQMLLAMTRIRM